MLTRSVAQVAECAAVCAVSIVPDRCSCPVLHQVHYILNELVMGGMVLETNMSEIIARIEDQSRIEKQEVRREMIPGNAVNSEGTRNSGWPVSGSGQSRLRRQEHEYSAAAEGHEVLRSADHQWAQVLKFPASHRSNTNVVAATAFHNSKKEKGKENNQRSLNREADGNVQWHAYFVINFLPQRYLNTFSRAS